MDPQQKASVDYLKKDLSVLEILPFGAIVLDDAGHIVYCNQVFNDIDLDPQDILSAISNDPESRYNKPLKIKVSERYFSAYRKMVFNQKGEPSGQVIFVQDMSESEGILFDFKTVKDLQVEFKAILESSYDGIYVANEHGYAIYVNSAYEKLTGTARSEIVNKHIRQLTEEGLFSHTVTEMVLEKKKTITDVVKCQRTGKQLIVTGNPVMNADGRIKRVVVNLRDITELVTLEKQLEKTRMLSDKYYMELSRLRLKEGKIMCNSPQMKKVLELALRIAQVDSTILIYGESGVGKELIADVIHNNSNRKNKPFVKINCSAIPENLLESELFGYEEGAFTGARKQGKPGLFEVAEGGSILLDEIGEMSLNLQIKLLRVLQEAEIRRIGGTHNIKINVRIIAATNKDLEAMVREKLFRQDLYYRLNVVPIYVPLLRDRKEDIPIFIAYFLDKFNEQYKLDKKVSPEVVDRLVSFHWPGNVRELENIIERIVVTTPHAIIECEDLPDYLNQQNEFQGKVSVNKVMPLKEAIAFLEKDLLAKALAAYKSKEKAAQALGVDRTTVLRKAIKYKLN